MLFTVWIDKTCREEVMAKVHQRTPLIDEIERLVLQENRIDQLPGYLDDEITLLEMNEIQCFVVENEKTFAVYADGKKYAVRKRLYALEDLLPDGFERISKSAIANWKKITKFKVQLSGAVDAVFQCGYAECISRRCFTELKRRYGL